mgnify:CR=1 FL=1
MDGYFTLSSLISEYKVVWIIIINFLNKSYLFKEGDTSTLLPHNIVSNLLNVPEEKAEFSYLALLLLLFIILLLIFFFVIFWRRRKKKKEDDEKKTKNTDEIGSLEKGGNTHVSLK